jgi:hypothetical protein
MNPLSTRYNTPNPMMPSTDEKNSQIITTHHSNSYPATMASSLGSTLYPKITTHVTEMVHKELHYDSMNSEGPVTLDSIPIVGSVKLHGTHADILIYSDDRIVFQSRNIVGLQVAKDNAGFAATMSQKTKALLRLRDLVVARFSKINPEISVEPSLPVLIAGEWIGESIQKGVAISKLSKRFVIISINVNGQWQKDSDYSGIALPNHDVYNVSRAGVFNRILYPENPQRTINDLETLAEEVARQCPFAATFGLDGEGEGIVWKPALAPYNSNPSLWFKTKGGRFKPTYARPPRQSPESAEQDREAAAAVAKIWTSEQRLEQGLDYMKEHGIQRIMKNFSPFLKWVQNDIVVEEKRYIAEHKIDALMLRIEVAKIAKPWYVERLNG